MFNSVIDHLLNRRFIVGHRPSESFVSLNSDSMSEVFHLGHIDPDEHIDICVWHEILRSSTHSTQIQPPFHSVGTDSCTRG